MRLLIVGSLEGHISTAGQIAISRGAKVDHVDSIDEALETVRSGKSAELLFVDIKLNIDDLVTRLAAERISIPVVSFGIGPNAGAAVGATRQDGKVTAETIALNNTGPITASIPVAPIAAVLPTDAALSFVARTVAEVERDLIIDTLQHCLGNRTHAANILGISIRTLRNKLKLYSEDGVPVPMPGESEIRTQY